jgi:outer membrane lipoprotein LolB
MHLNTLPSPRRQWLAAATASTALWLAGCSTAHRTSVTSQSTRTAWSGRLALQVQTPSPTDDAAQSFSATFELEGTPESGSLHLYTPLGSSAGRMTWSASSARLEQGGQVRESSSLQALIRETLGTDIPLPALFAWLQGKPQNAEGWMVDLQRYADGYVTAVRSSPVPHTRLLLILDR